jgi:hypothetical protein
MDARSSSALVRRHLVGAGVIAVMWWVAFHHHDRIPILTYVNLGIHEAGHFLAYSLSQLTMTMMGSIAQVAVPLLLGVYFILVRDDWMAAALCLAWGATSATEVAIYVADAPYQELPLIGGQHDWAYILGPEGYDAMDRAASLAQSIREGALIGLVVALALCIAGATRGPVRERAAAAAAPDTA